MHDQACTALHEVLNRMPRHSFAQLHEAVPTDGVYFLFESGERAHGGDRLVRIGSHTGKGNLASRLREHVRVNKDRSIFRKHIGRALLKRGNDPYLEVWNLDLTSRKAREQSGHRVQPDKQSEVEQAVSNYICNRFSIVVLPASDSTAACRFEALCIGTVSCCSHCSPSDTWLGRHADPRIGHSGLWQIMHLYRQGLTSADLKVYPELENALQTVGRSD